MRLIDKCKLTEFEGSRIECKDNLIVVTLGPYRNYRTRNKDFFRIVNNWRAQNNIEELPTSTNTASPKNLLTLWKWFIGKFFGRC